MSYVSEIEGAILPADDEEQPPSRRRPRLVVGLAAALAVALVLAAVLAVRLYRDEHLGGGQAGARDVVERYTAALDRHDMDGVRATSLDQASFTESESLRWPMLGPASYQERDDLLRRLFAADLRLRSSGPVQVAGDGPYRVSVRQTVHYKVAGITVDEDGMSLLTVVDRPDGPVVTEHIWWRLPRPPQPSMAWID